MKHEITLQNTTVYYELSRKAVKNINLRIKSDGSLHVSANARVPLSVIEAFLQSKQGLIFRALSACRARQAERPVQFVDADELRPLITSMCEAAYPYFHARGVSFPQIKFRKMSACWGSCRSKTGILTFNTNLMYAPRECIRYVVYHEFCHFLEPNHSPAFYDELHRVCPDWQALKARLKEVRIP